jgi:phosphoserine phosphatase
VSASPVKLVAFDMEGCLTADPTVWELMHRQLGTWQSHGLPYWHRYLAGGLHYDEFARMDVAVWRGAPEAVLREAARQVPLMPGCAEALRELRRAGLRLALISNGLTCVAEQFQRDFGFTHVFANTALSRDGTLTGELDLSVPYEHKGLVLARIAAELGLGRDEIASVGDSAADVAMFAGSAVSIAVQPRDPAVAASATHVIADHNLLQVVSIVLGGR